MSSWAKPGVKCVCIFDDWETEFRGRPAPSRVPMIGEILTITEVFGSEHWGSVNIPGGAAMCFDELGHAWCFAVANFRPLITKTEEQDVALFRHLLDGLPIGEMA